MKTWEPGLQLLEGISIKRKCISGLNPMAPLPHPELRTADKVWGEAISLMTSVRLQLGHMLLLLWKIFLPENKGWGSRESFVQISSFSKKESPAILCWWNDFLVREVYVFQTGGSCWLTETEVSSCNASWLLRWPPLRWGTGFISLRTSIPGHTKKLFIHIAFIEEAYHMPGIALRAG